MIEFILSVVSAVVLGGVTYLSSTTLREKTAGHFAMMRKERALARIKQEPHYRVGSVVTRCISPGSGALVCENYYIAELGVGRVLLAEIDGTDVLPMTGMDFEEKDVTIDTARFIGDTN